jgi:hypothetical protein
MERPETSYSAVLSALETARENEKRWIAMAAELSSDAEQMEQWRSTARLRRLKVSRLEVKLAISRLAIPSERDWNAA